MHILLLERPNALWLMWVRREDMVLGINVTNGDLLCQDEINPVIEEIKEHEWGRHMMQGLIGNSPKDDPNWVCSIVHSVLLSEKCPSILDYHQNDLEALVLKQTNQTPINDIYLSSLVRKYGLFPIRRVINWIANVESHTGKSISAAVQMNDVVRNQNVLLFHSKPLKEVYAIRHKVDEEYDISEAIVHNKHLHSAFKLKFVQAKKISDEFKTLPISNLTIMSIEVTGCITNCEYYYSSTQEEEVTLMDKVIPHVLDAVENHVVSDLKNVFINLSSIL